MARYVLIFIFICLNQHCLSLKTFNRAIINIFEDIKCKEELNNTEFLNFLLSKASEDGSATRHMDADLASHCRVNVTQCTQFLEDKVSLIFQTTIFMPQHFCWGLYLAYRIDCFCLAFHQRVRRIEQKL